MRVNVLRTCPESKIHMIQAFTNHRLAGPIPILVHADFLDVVTDYFAYIAFVSVAALIAIVSLGLSANVAVGFLDRLVKPAFFTAERLAIPAPSKPAGIWRTTSRLAG